MWIHSSTFIHSFIHDSEWETRRFGAFYENQGWNTIRTHRTWFTAWVSRLVNLSLTKLPWRLSEMENSQTRFRDLNSNADLFLTKTDKGKLIEDCNKLKQPKLTIKMKLGEVTRSHQTSCLSQWYFSRKFSQIIKHCWLIANDLPHVMGQISSSLLFVKFARKLMHELS